jgi:thiamine-phosphate pyrophosphorylase
VSAFADLLVKAITTADIACLRIAGDDAARVATIAKPLLHLAQDQGVAVLFDDADLTLKLRGDGVHLTDPALYAKARRAIGTDGIVGVACPLERHTAMEVGEAGADYVQFDVDGRAEALDLVAWWTEMMTVPSVVAGTFDGASAKAFIGAGADFLAPAQTIWAVPDPVAAIAALLG